jgi:hypothetical protein
VACRPIPRYNARNARTQRKEVIARIVFYVVRAVPISRKRFPQKQTRGIVGDLMPGNSAVKRLCQQYRLWFPWGPCKMDIRESSCEAGGCSCGKIKMRIEGV